MKDQTRLKENKMLPVVSEFSIEEIKEKLLKEGKSGLIHILEIIKYENKVLYNEINKAAYLMNESKEKPTDLVILGMAVMYEALRQAHLKEKE